MFETEFVKRAKAQIGDLVAYLNKTGANIKVEDVKCCGAFWWPGAVLWKGAWYLVYKDSTQSEVRIIDTLADEVNEKYSEYKIRKGWLLWREMKQFSL